MFHCSHPNAFFQPHLHPRGCSGVFLLGLGFQGCSGACSTPFSRLLQPSVRGVVDLGVMAFGHHPLPSPSLCGRVTLSVGVHSVYAPVGESGRLLASFDLREAYIPVPVHPASCPFLRFLFRDTVYQLQALYFGLSTAPQVFPWVMAPVSAILHSLGIRMRRSLDTWLVQSSSHGRSSFWDCLPSQVFQPHTFPGSAVSVGRLRFHLFQGFSVGGSHLSAAICNRRIYVMRLAYRELVAVASRRSFFTSSPSSGRLAFFLRWLASFLAATWDCSPSSSASIVPGGSNVGVDGVSSRSPVVAPSPSSLSRRVSAPSVSCPSLLVRRLGRGLGRPSRLSGRFGPVGHPSGGVVYLRQGTASCSAGDFPVPVTFPRSHSGCLLRRLHSCAFPSQGGCPWSPLLTTLAPAILR